TASTRRRHGVEKSVPNPFPQETVVGTLFSLRPRQSDRSPSARPAEWSEMRLFCTRILGEREHV
ncbi:hypothetical protein, partial [Dietzia natronolimnaea]|uniref:hypothetical protein n=1 Tax=Dietzia natronolimnaea TaxID=161920 RepID=UPI0019D5155D